MSDAPGVGSYTSQNCCYEASQQQHSWSSGRIGPCHGPDPGSIPGECIPSLLILLVLLERRFVTEAFRSRVRHETPFKLKALQETDDSPEGVATFEAIILVTDTPLFCAFARLCHSGLNFRHSISGHHKGSLETSISP